MLILTRKTNQSIMIGDEIEIVIVEVRGDQVKLGIKAPKNIPVHRSEVYKEIQEQNKKASSSLRLDSVKQVEKILHRKNQ
ncbi:MAG: carbon storage regulator CsrA [Leptospiraceae bacterium]|nr:carbon storage regulator CsrA [Leptospiraceae bacterium]MDW7976169.1 carbon storage regulator CsrA [Leptospiraceae bacterium]